MSWWIQHYAQPYQDRIVSPQNSDRFPQIERIWKRLVSLILTSYRANDSANQFRRSGPNIPQAGIFSILNTRYLSNGARWGWRKGSCVCESPHHFMTP
ncbi:hypothetical protein P691DRAFT_809991 [Macrolepiota fuliginosa MF-IS2]|uniref:Uncharacterized protein n=1 Tax=Macrolepiota fuliginosa MF-IS2 TaxID=1400762 RepID=A0A9P5X1P0_9AGAR|nr:hypothetical protein P691DRAFT_809991 [Macrolepiota fuliginosa MF-IS2]